MPAPSPERSAAAAVHRMSVPSPFGVLTLFQEGTSLTRLLWAARARIRNARPTPLLAEAAAQLDAYFDGRLTRFDLPVAPSGTPFEQTVWQALSAIPHGTVLTYGQLAERLNTAPRAIGRACGANPLPILIPCHRVIAASGELRGYSGGGGLETKAGLLRLEGMTVNL